jgi:hypothetical protein
MLVLAVVQVVQVTLLLQVHPKVLQAEQLMVQQLVTVLEAAALLLLEQLLQ